MPASIYLDHNATAPLLPEALEALSRAAAEAWGNPSSLHAQGREARKTMEEAREKIGALMGVPPAALVFTGGGTEACNLGFIGAAKANRDRGKHLVVSAIEHSAVRSAAIALKKEGWELTWVKPNSEGLIEAASVAKALRPDTVLCAVMAANNEVGSIQPVREIGALLREGGVLFFCDAVQALGKIPLELSSWPVDLAAVAAHKIGGPKGVGALYVRKGVSIDPHVRGGSQERGLRGGTENAPGIAGFGAAAAAWLKYAEEDRIRLRGLRDALEQSLVQRIPGIRVNAAGTARVPNTLNVTFPGCRGDILVMALDMRGIAVSAGSACASGSVKPSEVLLAMGRGEEEAMSSLRFSFGSGNASEEIPRVVEAVEAAYRGALA